MTTLKKIKAYRDEEDYFGKHGVGRSALGDASLHKQPGSTEKSRARAIKRMIADDAKVIARRVELSKEFEDRLARGEIRLMTPKESLLETASGHPDNESVKAARRILKRRFDIDWEESK